MLVALPVGLLASPGSGGSDRAESLLLKSMRRELSVNVIAVLVQRDPFAEGSFQTVRIERNRQGWNHYTVLEPLRMQGMEAVDDGSRLKLYFPDRNLMIDQDSPLLLPDDAEWRMALAKKNYEIRFTRPTKVAGRETKCIRATPHDARVAERRYYIDAKTGYPLRLEILEGDQRRIQFDTREIQFPESIDTNRFKMSPVGTARKMVYRRPQNLTENEAKGKVGFHPIVPGTFPMGFQMQEMQMTSGDSWRALVMRLTDGLVKVTVYQWRGSGPARVRAMDSSTAGDAGETKLLVVSDLPPSVRKEFLEAFQRAAQQMARAEHPAVWSAGDYGLSWVTASGPPEPSAACNRFFGVSRAMFPLGTMAKTLFPPRS
ncbi:MAG: sigma-E factor regulatory protein RseB domain-containing protein [Fimbriimonadaceae bacterium]|nr:sigma-E factor regulatory protein RseB domain-containing protein [Fimbriimonadaceae bacterium]